METFLNTMDVLIVRLAIFLQMRQSALDAIKESWEIASMQWESSGILNTFVARIAKSHFQAARSLRVAGSRFVKRIITSKQDHYAEVAERRFLEDPSLRWGRSGIPNILCVHFA